MTSDSIADPRTRAQRALANGDIAGAVRICRDAFRHDQDAAQIVSYPAVEPAAASSLASAEQLMVMEDPPVGSTAVLIDGLMQYPHWNRRYTPPAIRLFRLRNCTIHYPNVVVTAEGAILDDNAGFRTSSLCNHVIHGFPGLLSGSGHVLLRVPVAPTERLREPAFFLNASPNYASWLFADLPRLVTRTQTGLARLILHGETRAFHLDSLRALGVASDDIIRVPAQKRIECEELFYCTSTFMDHAPSARGLAHVRERLALAGADTANRAGARRVYLSREREQASRPLLNERELIAYFQARGFDIVAPETLGFREQVTRMRDADTVAGPYGANLANGVFPVHASHALIIATKEQPEFSRMFSALGVPHAHACAEPVKLKDAATFSESSGFRVALDDVGRCLDALGVS
jgi:capsular polysaccharide biosynthesis protein